VRSSREREHIRRLTGPALAGDGGHDNHGRYQDGNGNRRHSVSGAGSLHVDLGTMEPSGLRVGDPSVPIRTGTTPALNSALCLHVQDDQDDGRRKDDSHRRRDREQ
jgi:hypothetical protein